MNKLSAVDWLLEIAEHDKSQSEMLKKAIRDRGQAREIIAKIASRLNVSAPAVTIEHYSVSASWAALGEAIIEKIDQDSADWRE